MGGCPPFQISAVLLADWPHEFQPCPCPSGAGDGATHLGPGPSLSARVGGMDEMDLANAITIAVRTMPRGPGKRINPATASAADLENVLRHLQRQHGVSLGVPAARASGSG